MQSLSNLLQHLFYPLPSLQGHKKGLHTSQKRLQRREK